ncbi:MAG TPA: alpha/beta fold hydrolase [Ktedonobacterales bacterium]|nr:alpha/beta fold hydrolase [Ktedonobacterales bacterium]
MTPSILDLPAPPTSARISYGPGEEHFADLRLPPGTGPFPVVIGIHGGYWRARYGLDHFGHLCAALTSAGGIATWNIEYRRLGDDGGGWPGTFADVARAADALRTVAATYPLDLARVFVVGHSAGGQLALWLAGRHRISASSPLHSPHPLPLAGAVSLAGVTDLRLGYELRLSDSVISELLGGSPGSYPERYAAVSPLDLLPLGARQLLITGDADTNVPPALTQRYYDAARAGGDPVELLVLPGTGHFEIIDPRSREWPRVAAAILSLTSANRDACD